MLEGEDYEDTDPEFPYGVRKGSSIASRITKARLEVTRKQGILRKELANATRRLLKEEEKLQRAAERDADRLAKQQQREDIRLQRMEDKRMRDEAVRCAAVRARR